MHCDILHLWLLTGYWQHWHRSSSGCTWNMEKMQLWAARFGIYRKAIDGRGCDNQGGNICEKYMNIIVLKIHAGRKILLDVDILDICRVYDEWSCERITKVTVGLEQIQEINLDTYWGVQRLLAFGCLVSFFLIPGCLGDGRFDWRGGSAVTFKGAVLTRFALIASCMHLFLWWWWWWWWCWWRWWWW